MHDYVCLIYSIDYCVELTIAENNLCEIADDNLGEIALISY